MSDFDFDEIDKAVTGALGSEPVSNAAPYADNTDAPSAQASQPTPASRRNPSSSGRFMDMVHPSSDMRRAGSDAPIRITPNTQDSRIPEPPAFFQAPESPGVFETPDAPDAPDARNNTWSTPLESPFLADAKVEKRPLGGNGDAPSSLESQLPYPTEPLLESPEEELKIEASDEPLLEATTLPDPIDFLQSQEPLSQPVGEEASEKQTEVTSAEQGYNVPSPELEEVITTPASITQQYKEQVGTPQESGSIYDTESYHKPLVAPTKKRSGAWVFLWIFVLVVVGAGIGAALYFFVLPTI